MKASLEALNKELHVFTEVRGMGLLIGCELIPELRAQLAQGRGRSFLTEAVYGTSCAAGSTVRTLTSSTSRPRSCARSR